MNTKTPNTETSTNALPLPADSAPGNPQSSIRPSSIASDAEEENPQSERIARLPKATRDMINLMLDDGLPYHVIIDDVGETAQGLNTDSLAKPANSGYEH